MCSVKLKMACLLFVWVCSVDAFPFSFCHFISHLPLSFHLPISTTALSSDHYIKLKLGHVSPLSLRLVSILFFSIFIAIDGVHNLYFKNVFFLTLPFSCRLFLVLQNP